MKKISTITGIVVIVAVAIILFGGAFAYEYFFAKNPITQISTNQIAGWKTYNSQYGFSLEYPATWDYQEMTYKAGMVYFWPPTAKVLPGNVYDSYIELDINANPSGLNIPDFELEEAQTGGTNFYKLATSTEDKVIDGHDVVIFKDVDMGTHSDFPIRHNFAATSYGKNEIEIWTTDDNTATFEQVLSTLKFTN